MFYRFKKYKYIFLLVFLSTLLTFLIKFHYNNNIESKNLILFEQYKLIVKQNKNFSFYINNNQHDFQKELENDLKELFDENTKRNLKLNNLNSPYKTYSSQSKSSSFKTRTKYLILEYTNVFFRPKFCDKSTQSIFNSELEKCEFNNCDYTCDKINSLKSADVLLFHQRDLEAEYQLNFKLDFSNWLFNTKQIPFKTSREKLENNPDQIWVLWNDEATPIDKQFNRISKLFNWTLSFKTDAEVFEGTYGLFKYNSRLSGSQFYKLKKEIFDNFIKRQNAILWFVSNCDSKYRTKIALEISKYYQLHIYGKCDLVKDLTESELNSKYPYLKVFNFKTNNVMCEPGSLCEEEKFKSYKYYLAFENKNCTDYVTEKVWKSLNKHMIPIVLQPSRESYIRYSIPSKSFIHLQDFEYNSKLLTDHLFNIDRNFTLYYNYLKWTYVYLKAYYNGSFLEPHRMCQLCKKLNLNDRNVYYNNIAHFFNDQCKSGD